MGTSQLVLSRDLRLKMKLRRKSRKKTFLMIIAFVFVTLISVQNNYVVADNEPSRTTKIASAKKVELLKDDAYVEKDEIVINNRDVLLAKNDDDIVTFVVEQTPTEQKISVRLSWYDPELCVTAKRLINCGNPAYWWNMGDGKNATEWYDRALACPKGFYGRTFVIDGLYGPRTCYDGGGQIFVEEDGTIRLDVLTKVPIRTGLYEAIMLNP